MQRISVKTLVLMLLLLVAVLAHQHIRCVPAATAGVLWLAGDPNDPNESSEPGPESLLRDAQRTWLDVEPQDANEPLPETVGWIPILAAPVDDPNDPGEPGPEYV
jgi:hypothetical protein